MGAQLFGDPEQERRDAMRAAARRAAVTSYRATATQAQAQNLSNIVAAYPHLTPQTAVPLAMAGQTADSELTAQVAFKAAKNNMGKRHWWSTPLDIVGDVFGGAADLLGEAGEVGTDILKPVTRTGLGVIAAPFEEGAGAVRAIAANAGDIAAGAVSGLVSGAATGAATLTPWGVIGGAIGGTVIGGVGGALAQAKGVKVEGEGWRPQSTILTSLTGGGSMGQGYLPGGTAAEHAAERARETGRIGEHAFTPGRFLASAVFDEDTAPYKLLSGLVDATNAWELDPMVVAGKAFHEAKATGALSGRFDVPTKAQKLLGGAEEATGLADDAERAGAELADDLLPKAAEAVAPPAVPVATPPPKPLPQLRPGTEGHVRSLSEVADVVYRDTGPLGALGIIPESPELQSGMAGLDRLHFSNTPDMALGQAGQTGLLFELDAAGLQGKVNLAKPGLKQAYDQGMAELIAMGNDQASYQKAVRRVTIRPDMQITDIVQRRQLQNTFRSLERKGWVKEVLEDGSTRYTRPDLAGGAAIAGREADAYEAERAAAGLVDGAHRPAIIPENARAFLDSAKGVKLKNLLAKTDDYEDLRRILGDGVDHKTLLEILDAKSVETIDQALVGRLGLDRGLETSRNFTVGAGKLAVERVTDRVRFLGKMPSEGIKWSRPQEAIEQYTRLQRSAKMPAEAISRNNEALARALAAGDIERAEGIVLRDFVGHEKGVLAQAGAAPEFAKKLGDRWASINQVLRRELIDEIGQGDNVGGVIINGETRQLALPHLIVEGMDEFLKLDPKEIRSLRRSVGMFSPVFQAKYLGTGVAGGIDTAAWLTNKVWKVSALFRGSYITRNLAEAQARMGAVGLDTAFRHPIDYLAWVVGDQTGIANALRKVGGGGGRGRLNILGEAFDANPALVERELRGAMNHFAESIGTRSELGMSAGRAKGRDTRVWQRGEVGHAEAMADHLERLHSDPLARRIANSGTSARTNADFPLHGLMRDPEMRDALDQYARLTRQKQMSSMGGRRIPDEDAVMSFANNTRKHVQEVGGNSPEMFDAIATGELDGIPMRLANGRRNPRFTEKVQQLVADGHGPNAIKGRTIIEMEAADKLNRGVNRIYEVIDTVPMGKFTYGPAHKQAYWQEAKQMIVAANPEAQARIIDMAQEARMPKDFVADLRARAAASEGELNAEAINGLIDQRAGDQLKKLLYQANEKTQLQDILRIVFPFMGAQMNSLKVWAKLGMENPAVPARVNQIFHGARGTGTFYKDPQTGEEMFTYPGSGILTQALLGVKVPLGGAVAGLNMFGSGLLPGAGPMVQMPVRWFLPDKPKFDQIREFLDPYGEAAEGGTIEQFGPPWIKRLLRGKAADPGDKAFGDAIFSIYSAGLSNGKYSNSTPEAMAAGLEDAKHRARLLYVIEGVAAGVGAPNTPSHEFMAADKDGRWWMMGALKEEYRAFMDEDPRTAMTRFVDKFGINVVSLVQPSTYTGGKIVSDASTASGDWARTHEDLIGDYENIYGLFSPSVNSDEFDSQTWARQQRNGERWPLNAEQRAKLANDKLAKTIFYNAKDRFGPYPSAPQKEVLRALHEALQREYPGYEENVGLPEGIKVEQKIADLERAVRDERLADNPVIGPTRAYLAARAKLNELAVGAGRANINAAKDMAPYREILRRLGNALADENPAFGNVWDRVLRSEIDIDEVEEVPVGA